MFTAIVSLMLIIIAIAVFKDWLRYPLLFKRASLKKIQTISQLITLEQFEEAKLHLHPLLQKKKICKRTALCHVKVLRGTGELERALEVTCTAARRYPEELFFRLEEAIILLSLHRPQEALDSFKICEPIIREEKELYLFALTNYKLEKFEESYQILDPLLPLSQDADLFILAGDCKSPIRQFRRAIELYNHALTLLGEDHALYIKLADSYRRHGNLSQSEKMYRHILEKDEGDCDATLGLGICLIERGLLQKAYLFFQSSKAWKKEDHRIYFQAALLAVKLKRYDEADLFFEPLLEESNPSLETLVYCGYCLEKQQKWKAAEGLYLRMTELYPNHLDGYQALSWLFGVGLSHQLSVKEGLFMAHTALQLAPGRLSWEILSACEARSENYVRAYQILESLAHHEEDLITKQRFLRAMRQLKKNLPLNNNLIFREKVA